MLDFEGLGRELLANAESFVSNLFPQGKRRGAEWCIGSLGGEPGESLKINLKTGIWKDFADEGIGGGDLISLYAARHNLTQKMAAEELGAGKLRESMPRAAVNLRPEPERILERPPEGVARPKMKHPEFGLPVKFWVYRDQLGPLGLVARYEPPGGGKQIVPWTWDSEQGRFRARGFPKPRPLYGLEHLHSRPGEPVLIVEGEKACDAARTLMPRYVCITWSGGTGSVSKADWAPLQGRDCTFWPDADIPGVSIVDTLYGLLAGIAPRLRWIDPDGLPEGHDAADLLVEGWDTKRVLAWARPRLREKPHEPVVVPRGTEVLAGATLAPEATPVGDSSASEAGEPGESSTDESQNGYEEYTSVNPQKDDGEAPTLTRGKPRDDAKQSRVVSLQAQGIEISSIGNQLSKWQALGLSQKTSGNREPHANMDNVVRVIENDSNWKGQLWLDTFHRKIMRSSVLHPLGRMPIDDGDYVMLQLYLQRTIGIADISLANCKLAVKAVAVRDQRNELTDWLDSLEWDGVERLAYLFCDGFGTFQNEYTMAVSRCFLVSMIARAYDPGCKVDTVPILEGEQGAYKGTALEILGGYWYTENHTEVTNKDFYQILQGRWLTEIAEMHSFRKDVLEKVKGVISCKVDNFRVPYQEHPAEHPRQGVMAGSTNRDDWNGDDTGARRFWPIACTEIDITWLRTNRAQLFAEARALYLRVAKDAPSFERVAAGAAWWDVPKELAAIETEARRPARAWEGRLFRWIYFDGGREEGSDEVTYIRRHKPMEYFSVDDVLSNVIKMELSKQRHADVCEIASILKGFKMKKKFINRRNVYFWPTGFVHPEISDYSPYSVDLDDGQ